MMHKTMVHFPVDGVSESIKHSISILGSSSVDYLMQNLEIHIFMERHKEASSELGSPLENSAFAETKCFHGG